MNDEAMFVRWARLAASRAFRMTRSVPTFARVTGLVLLSVAPATAQLRQQAKLIASDRVVDDQFSDGVAIHGDTAIVGAPQDEPAGGVLINSGSAYVFVRTGSVWTQQQKLTASDAATADFFGKSVAISGDTAIVGAQGDDVGIRADQGSAYVFVRSGTTWTQQRKLTAPDGADSDLFGSAVALDGDTAVIGAWAEDPNGLNGAGSAYVFVRSGTSWTMQQKLIASDAAAGETFGEDVAISGDSIVVGAVPGSGATGRRGAAYVFVRSGTTWTQQQKLTASDGLDLDVMGESVAISGDTVVAGAPGVDGAATNTGAAYVFVRSGSVWTEQQKLIGSGLALQDQFGRSVAIADDTAVIGAADIDVAGTATAGAAFVFARSGTTWTERRRIVASDPTVNARFGSPLAVSGDSAIVAAPEADAAYVFVCRPGSSLGGHVTRTNGCGALTISASGDPLLGTGTVTYAAPGALAIMFGEPTSAPLYPLCTCVGAELGTSAFLSVPPPLVLVLPCDPGLAGITFAAQAGGAGAQCLGIVDLSHTIDTTFGL